MDRTAFPRWIAALAAVTVLGSSGCSRQQRIIVGSKNFTEQLILGEIIAQHIEHKLHQPVVRRLNLGGTLLTQQALLSSDIDLYPEYTGTMLTNVLKQPVVTDTQAVFDRVRVMYQDIGLHVFRPLGFNNSFAMTVRGPDARTRHLNTLSDAAIDPHGFVLGAGYEFMERPDGYANLNSGYMIHWTAAPKSMDLGLLYPALEQNQVSMVAGNMTDGLLSKLDVKVLDDNKHIFPPYQAVIVARSDSLTKYAGLQEALAQLSGKLTTDSMRQLNYEVDGQHKQPADVAAAWLRENAL